MKYYKTTRKTGSSPVSMHIQSDLKQKYSTEKFVECDENLFTIGFGFFVFTSLEAAKESVFSTSNTQIWEVEVGEIKDAPEIISDTFNVTKEQLLKGQFLETHISTVMYNYRKEKIAVTNKVKLLQELAFEY